MGEEKTPVVTVVEPGPIMAKAQELMIALTQIVSLQPVEPPKYGPDTPVIGIGDAIDKAYAAGMAAGRWEATKLALGAIKGFVNPGLSSKPTDVLSAIMPRWKHDDERAVFLGHHFDYDLYWSPGGESGAYLLARWGEAHNWIRMVYPEAAPTSSTSANHAIDEAKRRAIARGLMIEMKVTVPNG